MYIFLIIAFIGLIAATVNDIKKREVADWISYALLATMFAAMIVYSVIEWNFSYSIKAVCLTIVFYGIGNILYYTKLVGGGDVKLITAIAPVFVFINILNFIVFVILVSGIYGLIYSITLAIINRKKMSGKLKYNFLPILFIIIFVSGIYYSSIILVLISIIVIAPYLILFVSAVEKNVLIKKYSPQKLSEGDWLLKDIKIGKRWIRAKAEGLTNQEIMLIKRKKINVWIKEGIPYVPVLLIAFILTNLINILEIIKAFF